MIVSIPCHNNRDERADHPHGENAVDQDFALGVFVAAALHHEIRDQSKNQAGGDAPVAHSGEQHNDAEQQAADGQHTKLFNFGEKQHHGDAADQRNDHTDERDENRDKANRRRGKDHDKVDRRKNTDVD